MRCFLSRTTESSCNAKRKSSAFDFFCLQEMQVRSIMGLFALFILCDVFYFLLLDKVLHRRNISKQKWQDVAHAAMCKGLLLQ